MGTPHITNKRSIPITHLISLCQASKITTQQSNGPNNPQPPFTSPIRTSSPQPTPPLDYALTIWIFIQLPIPLFAPKHTKITIIITTLPINHHLQSNLLHYGTNIIIMIRTLVLNSVGPRAKGTLNKGGSTMSIHQLCHCRSHLPPYPRATFLSNQVLVESHRGIGIEDKVGPTHHGNLHSRDQQSFLHLHYSRSRVSSTQSPPPSSLVRD